MCGVGGILDFFTNSGIVGTFGKVMEKGQPAGLVTQEEL